MLSLLQLKKTLAQVEVKPPKQLPPHPVRKMNLSEIMAYMSETMLSQHPTAPDEYIIAGGRKRVIHGHLRQSVDIVWAKISGELKGDVVTIAFYTLSSPECVFFTFDLPLSLATSSSLWEKVKNVEVLNGKYSEITSAY